jgi:sporulation-control protein
VVFKKVLRAFGVGGPTVDTVLDSPDTRPGGQLTGRVEITGGDHDVDLEHLTLALVTRVEVESHDMEHGAAAEFHRQRVAGAFRLAAGEHQSLPFQLTVPWETPITDVYGHRLPGMTMGVRTELAVARATDKGDLDPISVHPLAAHEAILDAFVRLGFRFKHADLERGRIAGVHQTLPFFQEIEFLPAPQYAGRINEVELTFVTGPQHVDVILEFDKRGGMFAAGHDAYSRFTVTHAEAQRVDWTAQLDGWMRQATERYYGFLGTHAPGHAGHGRRRHGIGVGGIAAGVAGGLIAGELLDEAFDGGDLGGDLGGDFGGDFDF